MKIDNYVVKKEKQVYLIIVPNLGDRNYYDQQSLNAIYFAQYLKKEGCKVYFLTNTAKRSSHNVQNIPTFYIKGGVSSFILKRDEIYNIIKKINPIIVDIHLSPFVIPFILKKIGCSNILIHINTHKLFIKDFKNGKIREYFEAINLFNWYGFYNLIRLLFPNFIIKYCLNQKKIKKIIISSNRLKLWLISVGVNKNKIKVMIEKICGRKELPILKYWVSNEVM